MPKLDEFDLSLVPGLEQKVHELALDLRPLLPCVACGRVHSRGEIFEMDYASPLDLSEILISGTCPDGFKKLFGDEDEDFVCEHKNGHCNSCSDRDACPEAVCKNTEHCYYVGSINCPGVGECQY